MRLRTVAGVIRQEPERASALLEEAEDELQLAIDELREFAHGIHPAVLADLGLAEGLRSLAVRSSIPVNLLEVPDDRLDDAAETVAYYVVAEAIANAQKHSRASFIQVRASAGLDSLRIEVLDDGAGGAAEHPGSGLEGLRDRAEAIGGILELVSEPTQGTRITVLIPASQARYFRPT